MSWMLGIGKEALSLLSTFVSNALKWAAAGAFWLLGLRAKKIKNLEEINDILKKQRRIQNKPDLHRSALLDRMAKRLRDE